jgi:hypothetical protein
MNADRINKLADFIESNSHPFEYIDCSTCALGHCLAMMGYKFPINVQRSHVALVWSFLGIGERSGELLMISPRDQDGCQIEPAFITREMMVDALRRFARGECIDPYFDYHREGVMCSCPNCVKARALEARKRAMVAWLMPPVAHVEELAEPAARREELETV